MRYAQMVMGPAGCGKSSYCSTMAKHGQVSKRNVQVVNLDPAAENFDYEPMAVSCEDVMFVQHVRKWFRFLKKDRTSLNDEKRTGRPFKSKNIVTEVDTTICTHESPFNWRNNLGVHIV